MKALRDFDEFIERAVKNREVISSLKKKERR